MKQYVLKSDSEMAGQLPSDFLADLNSAQIEAVFHQDGPVLVIAGAGSGKTRTLVHRVARLVNEGVSPESVLLLTFIRKAAEEIGEAKTNRILLVRQTGSRFQFV